MTNPTPTDHRERLQNALLAINKLQARIGELERARTEPIAVVGLACRFPGGADSPESFWRLLRDGVDAITEVPASRFPIDDHFDADPEAAGRTYSRWGGFVDNVDRFDPTFFGISPREAAAIDPQHRLLLEVGWEALERAGVAPGSLTGSRTGVFVGITGSDYGHLVRNAGPEHLNAYSAIGSTPAFIAGRLSYVLGLQGPSVAVDTACSSSLAAVHLACQSLRAGDCESALAGGVNLMLTPEMWITTSRNRMLSPTGRCRTFDAAADGFVRGEGCGVVVLKRLSRALADGDTVLAVIRGSAMNQDGATSGITVPNRQAQEAAIRDALASAGVRPHEVGYVEAHGTGTSLGDPIEMRALGAVLGTGRSTDAPFVVGSVKTNIGHLEAASGIAGLIKTILVLRHAEIPPHLHLREPSPHIPWSEVPAVVPATGMRWDAADRPRIAGVSSFGASGTNIHVVVEQAPAAPARPDGPELPAHLLTLSARSEPALRALAARYHDHLRAEPDLPVGDVCHTAAVGRTHFAHRLAVTGGDAAELVRKLAAYVDGRHEPGVVAGEASPGRRPRVAFLFTGQGAQYVGMGRQLYDSEPVFRRALDRCAALLEPHLDRPLIPLLFPAPGEEIEAGRLLDRTAYTQPALFALEWSLAELWRSWGVEPYAVLGHSVGEYVAACVAGVFSLEDGLRLIAERGRLMQALPAGGVMVAVRADAATVEALIEPYRERVSLAAVNGPQSTVVSGAAAEVERVVEQLRARGVECRPLAVSHAFHSPLLEPALGALEAAAAGVALGPPTLRLVSNLTGTLAGAETTYPAYWRRHAREPVQFARGVRTLEELGCDAFLEIGPAPVLLGMAKPCVADGIPGRVSGIEGPEAPATASEPTAHLWLPSLRRGRPDHAEVLGSVARLYAAGAPIDWAGFDRDRGRRKVWLPTYPFAGERFWIETAPGTPAQRPADSGGHPLLGAPVRTAGRQPIWEARLGADRPDWLADHRVHGAALMPAAAYVEMAVAAAAELVGDDADLFDVVLHEPMTLPEVGSLTVQFVATPGDDGAAGFEVFSLDADGAGEQWRLHASGTARPARSADSGPPSAPDSAPPLGRSAAEHYEAMARRGLGFGPAFRGVRSLRCAPGEAVATASLPEPLEAGAAGYRVHPVLLDACLQAVGAALDAPADASYLPFGFERLRRFGPLAGTVTAHATLRQPGTASDTRVADLHVHDGHGRALLTIDGLALRRVGRPATDEVPVDEWLYDVVWQPRPPRLPDRDSDAGGERAPLDRVLAPAAAHAAALEASPDRAVLESLTPELDGACATFAVRALRALGWSPAAGDTVEIDTLAAQLGIATRYRRLLGRILEMLTEDGLLEPAGDGWRVTGRFDEPAAEPRLDGLRVRFPDSESELSLLARCGAALAEALHGDADPLELLFPGGSLAETERMYRASPFTREANGLVASAVASLVAAAPADRRLRVLEIGAGTGGTTAHVLDQLPADRTGYTFTDVSPHFVERARTRFGGYGFVDFRTLDIARDPAAQGFDPGGYDLVIASNVLHATPDLRRTVANARSLLAPGGALVLLEGTSKNRFADLTVGLTDGWWCFADEPLRSYALLPADRWIDLLGEAGLEAQSLAGPGPFADQTVLVARAPRAVEKDAETGTWLVLADEHGTGHALADRLRARGDRCVLVRPADADADGSADPRVDPGDPGAFRALVEDATRPGRPPLRGVVHLWALDGRHAGSAFSTPAAELAAAQQRVTGSALHVVQALAGAGVDARVLLVTRAAQAATADDLVDPLHATLWGLGKAIAVEHPEFGCVRLDLDRAADGSEADVLLGELDAQDGEDQVAWRGGERLAARLVRRTKPSAPDATRDNDEPYELVADGPRVLEGLRLRRLERRAPGPDEVEVEVHATGLAFRDVLNALGEYPDPDAPLGGEFAGVIVNVGEAVADLRPGDVVFGIAHGAFRSHVTTHAALVAVKPAALTLPEAASLPSAFLTAHHALDELAGLRAGERVLIHAGAGGVGLAAIQVAQRAGAEVFATAGSETKRGLLRSLGVAHVFDSRSPGFADGVLAATGGRGVDVVLNSLSDPLIEAGFRSLGTGGRWVELGKRGVWSAERVARVRPDARYFTVDLAAASRDEPGIIRRLMAAVLGGFADGSLRPIPVRTWPVQEAVAAFRHMAAARHVGKVVVTHPRPPAVSGDASYLITGGLGGVGLSVAGWLVDQGARCVVLVGRSEPNDEARARIAALEAEGARVVTLRADVSRADDLDRVFATIDAELPPLRGVFHGALVLDDGALARLDWARFRTVIAPRVDGAWMLHERTAGRALDFFVLFSAAGPLIGSAGQANYTAANTGIDALAHARRGLGLPGLSIQWGAWEGVGRAAQLGFSGRGSERGIGTMTPDGALIALREVLRQGRAAAQVAVMQVDWRAFFAADTAGSRAPFFEALVAESRRAPTGSGAPLPAARAEPRPSLAAELAAAPPARRRALLLEHTRARVATVLGLDAAHPVDPRQPLQELGLDSLMAVELRTLLGAGLELPRPLPATLAFDYPTVDAIAGYLLQARFGAEPAADEARETSMPVRDDGGALDELSDEEAEALLLAELDELRN